MRRCPFRPAALLTLYAALSFTLAGCRKSAAASYRITVEIDDHGVLRSGTAVWRVRTQSASFNDVVAHLDGDAVVVDLPGRGPLFATLEGRGQGGNLIRGGRLLGVPSILFGDGARMRRHEMPLHSSAFDDLNATGQMIGATGRLECRDGQQPVEYDCPYLVRFGDPARPSTVQPVNPYDLAATYGPGVRLVGITITITDAPVTRGIVARLPWLPAHRGRPLDGYDGAVFQPNDPPARALGGGSFSAGD